MLSKQKARGARLPSSQDLHVTQGLHVMADTLLTIPEAAPVLGLTVQRVRVLAREGRLVGARKIGRDWLIPLPVVVDPPIKTKHGRRRP